MSKYGALMKRKLKTKHANPLHQTKTVGPRRIGIQDRALLAFVGFVPLATF